MTEVLHANIFFFITSIAVIVFTFVLTVLLYHVIKILRSVRRIVERVEAGTEMLAGDLEDLRAYVMEESVLARFFRMMTSSRKSHASHEEEDDEQPKGRTRARGAKPKNELKIKAEE